MLSHADFARLRLAQFRQDVEIAELEDWKFRDRLWVGEAIGFSEWLRLVDDPTTLRSMAIDFVEFPDEVAGLVLDIIGLPVRVGMTIDKLYSLLGPPVSDQE